MNEDEQKLVLDAIYQSIVDPIAICRIVESEDGTHKDLVYVRVNDAYEKINRMKKEDLIGRMYSTVWAGDKEDWGGLMIRVAETGSTKIQAVGSPREKSGFFEGESSVAPGFYQLFTFSPIPGWVVLIFRDMEEWHKVALTLKKKERLLRELTSKLVLAEEKTRRQIATTLHDRIGYSMVSMLHSLRKLEEAREGRHPKSDVRNAIEEMEKLIQEVRSFTFDISPPSLYEVGLEAAIEARCDHLKSQQGLRCTFKCEGMEPDLDENTKIILYQMVHELLVNVVKHAKATNALVKVRWGGKKVQIVVEDDGVGFIKNKRPPGSGIGLFSIKERLHSFGGNMNIVSDLGGGTTVSLVVPLPPEPKASSTEV